MTRRSAFDPGPVRRALLEWYRAQRRDLPWRREARAKDPYAVLVSEMMLQQTTVAAVAPRFEPFLDRFPDWASLARASESDVLAAWAGLGYYTRARNLRKIARAVLALDPPGFPRDVAGARALPGVGEYTAGAVLSIAFGVPVPAVDGNVVRVISRLQAIEADIALPQSRRRVRELAAQLVPETDASEFNQSLMELGARVCTPAAPACGRCPVELLCEARRRGLADVLPRKARAPRPVSLEAQCLLARKAGRVLLVREEGADFWELPGTLAGILAKGRAAADRLHRPPVRRASAPRTAASARGALRRELARLGIAASIDSLAGVFRHAVTWRSFRVQVFEGTVSPGRARPGQVGIRTRWMDNRDLVALPVATSVRKALALSDHRSNQWNHPNSPPSSSATRASRPSRSP